MTMPIGVYYILRKVCMIDYTACLKNRTNTSKIGAFLTLTLHEKKIQERQWTGDRRLIVLFYMQCNWL